MKNPYSLILAFVMVAVAGCCITNKKNDSSRDELKVIQPKQTVTLDDSLRKVKKYHLKEMYPVFAIEYSKNEMPVETLDGICEYFINKIEEHPFAKYICTFDHYAHTVDIDGGRIEETIVGSKNVLFCFGKKLVDPKIPAVRPRSISICETESSFVISFLEPPNPAITETMIKWIRDLATQ